MTCIYFTLTNEKNLDQIQHLQSKIFMLQLNLNILLKIPLSFNDLNCI